MWRPERRCPCKSKDGSGCRCPSDKVRWRAGLRVDGRKVSRTFATQREAKAWAAQQEADVSRGNWVDPRVGVNILFKDWVPEWQATRSVLKPATRAADNARLPKMLAAFGPLPLTRIDALAIRQWISELVDASCASKTIRHYHALLHNILELAVTARLLHSNPCVGTPLPELVAREHVYLTEVEAAALIDAHPERWRAVPILLLGTGLRWAEAVGLRGRYVDMAQRELTVAHTWSDRYGWQTPKTAMSRRTLGFGQRVAETIGPLVASPDMPVLRAPQGGMIRHGAYRERVWQPAVRRAGLEAKGITPHGLRHTHASWLISAGTPLPAIQRRLGHQSISVTADTYGGLMPRVDQMLIAVLDLALGDGVPDEVPQGL